MDNTRSVDEAEPPGKRRRLQSSSEQQAAEAADLATQAPSATSVRGLVNEGNTCYLNALLFAIRALPPLADWCRVHASRGACAVDDPEPCVVCAAAADLAALDRPAADGAANSRLASHRSYLHEDFAGNDQQDAAEAMRKLVERCVEAHARIGGAGPPPLLLDAPADGNLGSDGAPLGILVGEEMHCQG